jgi:hypothetical protein
MLRERVSEEGIFVVLLLGRHLNSYKNRHIFFMEDSVHTIHKLSQLRQQGVRTKLVFIQLNVMPYLASILKADIKETT